MDLVVNVWCSSIFFLAGLLIGRVSWGKESGESQEAKEEKKEGDTAGKKQLAPGEKRITLGWTVGSPVTGEVSYLREGTGRGARILPDQGMLYAPAAGKITKLYPTGNAMLLRTEYGLELLIQAGIGTNELEGRHYRPRIVQNEVVNKGKLLLEFDVEAIREEGYDPSVAVSVVEARNYGDVIVCDNPHVKAGEDLMKVCREQL